MTNNHRNLSGKTLRDALKAKSRRRREQLAGLAAASLAQHPIRNDLLPKLELVERAPKDLVVPARKLRKIEAAHLREVMTAIGRLGFCDPVLIDEQNRVLDGVVRIEAAKLLGLPHVPCIRANRAGGPFAALAAKGSMPPSRAGGARCTPDDLRLNNSR